MEERQRREHKTCVWQNLRLLARSFVRSLFVRECERASHSERRLHHCTGQCNVRANGGGGGASANDGASSDVLAPRPPRSKPRAPVARPHKRSPAAEACRPDGPTARSEMSQAAATARRERYGASDLCVPRALACCLSGSSLARARASKRASERATAIWHRSVAKVHSQRAPVESAASCATRLPLAVA